MTIPKSTDQILADLEFRIRRTETAIVALEAEIVQLRTRLPSHLRHMPSGVPRNPDNSDSTRLGIPGDHDMPRRRSHLRLLPRLSRTLKDARTEEAPNVR
jgi:hypothetical protein